MIDKKTVAENFVEGNASVARLQIANAFGNNQIEKKVRDNYVELLKKINVLRLLFLTGNLTDALFEKEFTPLQNERLGLEKILWP